MTQPRRSRLESQVKRDKHAHVRNEHHNLHVDSECINSLATLKTYDSMWFMKYALKCPNKHAVCHPPGLSNTPAPRSNASVHCANIGPSALSLARFAARIFAICAGVGCNSVSGASGSFVSSVGTVAGGLSSRSSASSSSSTSSSS